MNRISADLYPMRVNPQNFSKGDTVKKIYMDNIQTPYVGIVTSIIPSTNKVEVQWPHSTGLEDPWDLIKVNPIINPPVVKEDKAYDSYQKRKNCEEYISDLQPYTILKDYMNDHFKPILLHASDLFNEGLDKSEAFKKLKANYDNKDLIRNAIDKIYNHDLNYSKKREILLDNKKVSSEIKFQGNSDDLFKVSYRLDNENKKYSFNSYKEAFEAFKSFSEILKDLELKNKYASIVNKVLNEKLNK